MHTLGRMVVLVDDYDDAIDFYVDKLGFEVFVDTAAPPRRYVHVRLPAQPDAGIWFLEAESDAQRERVGNQTAGQPCAVLYTYDLARDYASLTERGVRFVRPPKEGGGASFAHFVDLYGNEFVLVELAS